MLSTIEKTKARKGNRECVLGGRKRTLQCSYKKIVREDVSKKMSQKLKMVRD